MAETKVNVVRIGSGPIIYPGLDPSIGENIQGPSVIRVPDWVDDPLGRFYLYFADHKGSYIRLAYADQLEGPWQVHVPGSLQLENSFFLTQPPEVSETQAQAIREQFKTQGIRILHDAVGEVTAPHIASPDVHVDDVNKQIVMYYHGLEALGHQVTRVATSANGIQFTARSPTLGRTYFRAFDWQGARYGMAMPGQFYRSSDPFGPFEKGPLLFNEHMRHAALWVHDNQLWVFWTQVGDAPEHIKLSRIQLTDDWTQWQASVGVEVLRPEFEWEGANAPLEASVRSTAYGCVNQLRDPAIFVDENRVYLLYAVGGEHGIAIAEVKFEQ